jgi:hypothetical protein
MLRHRLSSSPALASAFLSAMLAARAPPQVTATDPSRAAAERQWRRPLEQLAQVAAA